MRAHFLDSGRPIMFSADTCAENPILQQLPSINESLFQFYFIDMYKHKYYVGKMELTIRFEDAENRVIIIVQEPRAQQWTKGTV
jgi:hypothetical protein